RRLSRSDSAPPQPVSGRHRRSAVRLDPFPLSRVSSTRLSGLLRVHLLAGAHRLPLHPRTHGSFAGPLPRGRYLGHRGAGRPLPVAGKDIRPAGGPTAGDCASAVRLAIAWPALLALAAHLP